MSDSWRPRPTRQERLGRAQLSMTPGSAQGRIANAKRVTVGHRQETGGAEVAEAVFSYPGTPQSGEESPPYYNRTANGSLGTIIANTRSNTTGASTVSVKVNGVVVVTLTLPSGNHQAVEEVVEDIDLEYGDQITVITGTVGAGLSGLVVQCLIGD